MANPVAFNWIGGGTPPASLFGVQPPVAPTMPGQPPVAWDWMRHPEGPPATNPWATPDLSALFGGLFGQPPAPTPQPPAAPAPRQWRAGTPIANTFSGPVGQNYWDGNRFVIAGPPDPAPPATAPAPPSSPATPGPAQPAPTGGTPAAAGGFGQIPADMMGGGGGGDLATANQQGGGSLPGGLGGMFGGLFGGSSPTGASNQFGSQGWGTGLGLAGSAAGIGLGVPGLGVLGSLAGTGIDITNANRGLSGWLGDQAYAPAPLGVDSFLSAILNGMSLGLFGNSIERSAMNAFNAAFDRQPNVQNNTLNSPTRSWASQQLGPSPGGTGWTGDKSLADSGYGATAGPGDSYGGFDKSGYDPGGLSSEPTGNVDGGWQDAADAKGSGDPGLYAKGGKVAQPLVPGDPPGPDNRIIGAQTGEGVLTRRAMLKYPGLLGAANAGRLDPGEVRGLLGAKQRPDTPDPGDPQERHPHEGAPHRLFGDAAREHWYQRTEPRRRPRVEADPPPRTQPRLEMNGNAQRPRGAR